MMVATRSFPVRLDGQDDEIIAGRTRCDPNHPLVRQYPDAWREEGLADELRIRSECVDAIRAAEERDTRTREPLSRAGREERRQEEFWRSVDRQLHRDDRSSEERTEQDFYDRALAQIEESDAARVRDERIELGEAWYGRLEG